MADTRVPIQKRSIEKKQKILDAGFALFCEKGYYRTNTTEIAKCAGVSTGALYSYFKDKREVYIAALDSYLDRLSDNLFARLEGVCPIDPESFAGRWIEAYVEIYAGSGHILAQLRGLIMEDSEISRHFSASESRYISRLVQLLERGGISRENMPEKVYICCILIDSLRQEKAAFSHSELSFAVLSGQARDTITGLLS